MKKIEVLLALCLLIYLAVKIYRAAKYGDKAKLSYGGLQLEV